MKHLIFAFVLAFSVVVAPNANSSVSTFEDLDFSGGQDYPGPGGGKFWNGSDQSGGFRSTRAFFNNHYDSNWDSWDGWAYSNTTDTTTASFTNQYSANTGGAFSGDNYGVSYMGLTENPSVEFDVPTTVQGAYFTNTTYTYLTMKEGNQFARKFGAGDYLKLTITGSDGNGKHIGSVDFYLAKFPSDFNPSTDTPDDYIVTEWTWVDLKALGRNVAKIEFTMETTDVGQYGPNTPLYFAMDDLTYVAAASSILPSVHFLLLR